MAETDARPALQHNRSIALPSPLQDGQTRWHGQVPHGTRKVWLLALANRGSAPLEVRLRLAGSRQFACWQGAEPHWVPPATGRMRVLMVTPFFGEGGGVGTAAL